MHLNVFYAFHRIVFHPLKMFAFADRLGLVFVADLPLLYLMAAKNFPVKLLTGWSYEQLNVLHRAVGRVCITTAIGHFATFIWVWDKTLSPLIPPIRVKPSHFSWFTGLGFLPPHRGHLQRGVRKRLLRGVPVRPCPLSDVRTSISLFPSQGSRPYVLVCAFIFVTDRIVLRLTIRSTRATATVTILPDKKTVRVTLRPNPRSPLKCEFTATVDGPYGSCFAYECLRDSDVALLVAGGSGIAVIYPLVHELATTTASSRDEEHGTSLLRGNDAPKRIVMVWVVREKCQLSWLHGGELEDLRKLGVEIVTHVTQNNVVVGKRPKMKDVVEGVGCDLRSRDSRSDGGRERGSMGVVVCGPSGMVRDTRNSCAGMMRRGWTLGSSRRSLDGRANSIE